MKPRARVDAVERWLCCGSSPDDSPSNYGAVDGELKRNAIKRTSEARA